ncbi:DUF262 domain-containing HNH endonuclease family protein [bacterium]|jgi:uncharacterized protein with ParB-like and HNH nuclease domain|nr:DUF262 domain-containing HNH endonuclease family protein [bacterium]
MHAQEISINRFLSSNDTKFIIPVYQRNYDWEIAQCIKLFDDIIEVGKDTRSYGHFIGSIVYVHDDIYRTASTNELTVIDGQQRLTTITLLYIAIYNYALDKKDEALSTKINETYLINKFLEDKEKLKLRPTENNDKALKYLLRKDGFETYNEYSKIIENYNYFRENINDSNINTVLDGLAKLMFVEISLDRQKDDPQKIFESLNSTGLELTQADLIRNYILMRLNNTEQCEIYNNYWSPIENKTKDLQSKKSLLSNFMRDFFTLKNKKIPNIKNVYQEFKKNYPTSDLTTLKENLTEIKKYAEMYYKIINPSIEEDKEIRKGLSDINTLEINVSYPFLMQVYLNYFEKIIDRKEFLGILETIQSFVWRRFILGIGTNNLNKIFMTLHSDIVKQLENCNNNYLKALEFVLLAKKGNQRFPTDKELIYTLKEKDMYNIKPTNKKYMFEKLENYNNKEIVDTNSEDITIEHIFPRNPISQWYNLLSEEDYKNFEEIYLHTIANLTLSGNNNSLSNKTFIEKRDMNKDNGEQGYKYSRLWLNRFIKEQDTWDINVFEQRFELISNRFLEIWKYPQAPIVTIKSNNDVNIFDISETMGEKIEYVIYFDEKKYFRSLGELYDNLISKLYNENKEIFHNDELKERLQIEPNNDKQRRGVKLDNNLYYEANVNNNQFVNRMKYLLSLFKYDEEIFIKWESNKDIQDNLFS